MTKDELIQLVEGWMDFETLVEPTPADATTAWRSLLADAKLGRAVRKAVKRNADNDQVADAVFAVMRAEQKGATDEQK